MRNRTRLVTIWAFGVAFAILATTTLAKSALADDWISLGGNSQHNGQSSELGPTGADLLWQGTTSALFGGPEFTGGDRLVTMRFQSISVAPIVCYDLNTGQQKWSVDFAGTNSRSVPRGVRDGRAYATNFQETQQDTIIALDLATGARVWVSPVRAPLGIIWTACFAPDGDIVLPCAGDDIARLDAADGHAVWTALRTIPNTGAEAICVHGNSVYGFEGAITIPKVLTAWDLGSGARRYSSPTLTGDGDQEMPPTVAPDGTIYVKRDGGPLYALDDDGERIFIRWQRAINAYFYAGHLAVGLGGSLYCPDGRQLVRLDPLTGAELDRSAALTTSANLNPKVAVGADGTVYVGNSGGADGMLYALSPTLSLLWSTPVNGMTYGGPALGLGGALAVSGSGTLLKVFRSDLTATPAGEPATRLDLAAYPNPFRAGTTIRFAAVAAGEASLAILDAGGRLVRTLRVESAPAAGEQELRWDGRDESNRSASAGVYFLRLTDGGTSHTGRVQLIR